MRTALQTSPVLQATGWMAMALLSLSMMAVAARQLSASLDTMQILFLRSVLSVFIVVYMVRRHGGMKLLCTQSPGLHLVRNLAHLGGQYAWVTGLALISMAEVFALEFTTPVWALFIAAVFLREKITTPRIMALVAGMVGVLVILRPGFDRIEPATLLVLFGAFCFASAHIGTKALVRQHTPINILFWMAVIQLVVSLVPAVLVWVTPSWQAWLWVSVMAAGSMVTHYSQSRAFALADSMVVIPLDFLRLPLIALVGYWFYMEGIDWLVMMGALIMAGGNLVNIIAERKAHQTQQRTENDT